MKTSLTHAPHTHTFKNVGRRKGNRIRYQCDLCPRLGPWINTTALPPRVDGVRNFDGYQVAQLRAMARDQGLHGYSKMRKAELIEWLARETRKA